MSVRRASAALLTANGRRAARRATPDDDARSTGKRRAPASERIRGPKDKQDKCNAAPRKKLPVTKPGAKNGQASQQKAQRPRFRDPLPMKMRALPQSFWQQPNLAPSSAPGGSVCALPPLPLPILLEKAPANDPAGKGRPGSPNPEGAAVAREREEVVSAANTDLLFSLFRGVERVVAAEAQRRGRGFTGEEEASGDPARGEDGAPRRPVRARRGRPRKAAKSWAAGAGGAGVRDDDPCLVSAAADTIRPLLPKDSAEGPQVLAMVTLPEVDGDVSLPTLDVQHNYSQILSKLVMKL